MKKSYAATIVRIKAIDEIISIFREYLKYMSRFFEIDDFDSWCEGALKKLRQYSMAEDRHIYILKESASIVGFALVNKHLRFNTDGFAIAEFYIQKNHQRKGYGRKLAEHVFAQFPGNWEVAVSLKNNLALVFWEQAVSSCTDGNFIKNRNTSFCGYDFVFNTADEPRLLQ